MVNPIIEELCENLRSTSMHYTTIDGEGVKILEDIIEGFNKRFGVLVTVLISPSSLRATAVNLADIPRCVACVLFWVHLFFVYFQRSCNVTNLDHVNLLQEQVAAVLLDPRNMPGPDLNCIPPDQHDQDCAVSMTQSKISMISWSQPPPMLL